MTPAQYRAQAATIRRLVQTIEDPNDRKKFLDVAAAYDHLALQQQSHLAGQSIEPTAGEERWLPRS